MKAYFIAASGTILLFLSACIKNHGYAYSEKTESPPSADYRLIWGDDFSGDSLNLSNWGYRLTDTKRGDGYFNKGAISLDGKGHLILKAYKSGDKFFSGMIGTQGKFEALYGYFECRVKLNKATGHYPAFWLQSPRISDSINRALSLSSFPSYNGSEIDIFEYFDRQPEGKFFQHQVFYGGYGAYLTQVGPRPGWINGLDTGYHTFGLEWTPSQYIFNVDGNITWKVNQGVSQVPEYIILSDIVDSVNGGPMVQSALPDSFIVDYVHVYQKGK